MIPTQVSAYTLDAAGNSEALIEYQDSTDEDFNNEVSVLAEIGSMYKVTIPKVIVLSGLSKQASYYVDVTGDIAGSETIKVVPDETVELHTNNKSDVAGIITQDKTSWIVSELGTKANGLVKADDLTSGKWSGTFNFNINLEGSNKPLIKSILTSSESVQIDPNTTVEFDLSVPTDTNLTVRSGDQSVANAKIENGKLKLNVLNRNIGTTITVESSDKNVYENCTTQITIKPILENCPGGSATVHPNLTVTNYDENGNYVNQRTLTYSDCYWVCYCTGCGSFGWALDGSTPGREVFPSGVSHNHKKTLNGYTLNFD